MPTFHRVTIRDIASKLGVSHVTVSLALKDSSRISKGRREQVQSLAKEMGYRPDPILSSLVVYRQSKRPTHIHSAIAWINHWAHPEALRKIREFNAYWSGASAAAERFGYRLDEFVWQPDFTPQRFETILQTRNVRGVLIPPHHDSPDWGTFHWDNFSVIRFGLSVRSPYSHIVTADHLRGVVTAMEKIHSYGYKRIGFVVPGTFDLRLGGSWTGGFISSQKLLDLAHPLPPLVTQESSSESSFSQKFKQWVQKFKPDAILTVDGRVIPALKQLNLKIPQDIAVASTSVVDIPVSAGINQNSEEIGRVAVETLISLINSNDRGKPNLPRRILVEGTWVDGASLPNRNLVPTNAG
jgi:DNA-binding LacI/PurR family transcriptional regulator